MFYERHTTNMRQLTTAEKKPTCFRKETKPRPEVERCRAASTATKCQQYAAQVVEGGVDSSPWGKWWWFWGGPLAALFRCFQNLPVLGSPFRKGGYIYIYTQ